jgi:hypothetical protein
MDLMLTSFGVSHLRRRERRETDMFYRMPPASLAAAGQGFMPDYAALLIADRIVIDHKTYDLLLRGRHDSYGNMALMAKTLHDEGFVRLEDFDAIITQNQQLLEAMLERDMKELDSWVIPLKESVAEWHRFVEGFQGSLRSDVLKGLVTDQAVAEDKLSLDEERDLYEDISYRMGAWLHGLKNYSWHTQYLVDEALDSSRKRRDAEHRQALREVLSEYLSYVNANLLLSNELDCGFYDWCDLRPFYRDKFLRVARSSAPGHSETDNVQKLFEISFPEFTFWTPSNIVRALKDKRIVDLRQLVREATKGNVEFDREFATRVLGEVLKLERSIGKLRNFVSYATSPLGFLPIVGTPVQKAVEEAIVQPIAHHRRREYRWFYLISELTERFQGEKGGH